MAAPCISDNDYFGDMSSIVAGYHGRDRDNGFVDEDLAGFVPAKDRHRSLTSNEADPTVVDLRGQARRMWDAMPDGDACPAVARALASEQRADGTPITEMGKLKRLVRLAEQGHHGARDAGEEFAQQWRPKRDGAQRAIEYAIGYVIRDGLTPDADRGCCDNVQHAMELNPGVVTPPTAATLPAGAPTTLPPTPAGTPVPGPGTGQEQPGAPGESEDASQLPPDPWAPMDLGPYLRGEIEQPRLTCGAVRVDGMRFLYPGLEHACIGETESGKSWFALACVAAELKAGNRVVYIHFEEASPADTITRLLLLGVKAATIEGSLKFVGSPAGPLSPERVAILVEVAPTLVVLDGQNEGMAMRGMDIMKPEGAAAFRSEMVHPFTRVGAAVLSLDHVVKDKEAAGGGYGFGSIHKANAINGAIFLLENREPMGKDRRGNSGVYVTKDRPAELRRHGNPTKIPRKFHVAELVINAEPGTPFELALFAPADDQTKANRAERDLAELDDEVYSVIVKLLSTGKDPWLSTVGITSNVRRRRNEVIEAVERLVLAGRVLRRFDGRAQQHSLPTAPAEGA